MGIQVEFNPDLALRNIAEFKEGRRKKEKCIPEKLEKGKVYDFLREGQRNYWLLGQVPLVETRGNQRLSRPLAAVEILEATHLLLEGVPYAKGKYRVVELFNPNDSKIHFDGFNRL